MKSVHSHRNSHHRRTRSRAYSLTEILIAIAIILLFLLLPILAYTQWSKRARDDKRRTDLLKISQALEQYKAEKGVYPPDLETLVAEGYLPELPLDPRHGKLIPGEEGITYGYSYQTDGVSYTLTSRMEGNARGVRGGRGSGTLDPGNISGRFLGIGEGSVTGAFTVSGSVAGGVLNANFNGTVTGSTASGGIEGTLTGTVTGTISGSVTGDCTLDSGTVTGNSFTGTYSSCTLSPVPGSPSGPGVIVIRSGNPLPEEIPIARLTDLYLTPTAVIPTNTPYRTPTPSPAGTGGPVVPCTQTPVCTGSCEKVGRCGSYSSTRGQCQFTTRPNFATCTPVEAPDQPCNVTGQVCPNGEACEATYCYDFTGPPYCSQETIPVYCAQNSLATWCAQDL
ncbi:MAG: type II secretion system protein GspG [Patescibacteria group bacterium]|nr:type II secretion system protein GspG [Patescibacteria group bacterium]